MSLLETTPPVCDRTIALLQELTLLNLEHAESFRTAVDVGLDPEIRRRCRAQAHTHSLAAHGIQIIVAAAGEHPIATASLTRSEHRWWIDLRSIIGGKDGDSVILADAIRSERVAARRYHAAAFGMPERHVAAWLEHEALVCESALRKFQELEAARRTQDSPA